MAYMNQERKAKIASSLKPVLAKYGMKGTLRVIHHSTICLTLKSGPIKFGNVSYISIHHIDRNFDGVARDFLIEAAAALQSGGWYDRSDSQIDYFDTAYYIDINVGKWDKPYEVAA